MPTTSVKAQLKANIVYRDYRDADDTACKALEMRAMQGMRFPALQKFMSVFFRMGFKHVETFDAKSRQYDDYIIRVAEDVCNSCQIVGVGCATIKTVFMHHRTCKVGYIFDLRVDQDYQSHGIGKSMSLQLEELCKDRDVEFLYLSVNSDNVKAIQLYKKLGYVHASHRSPALALLVTPVPNPDVAIRILPCAEALRLTSDYYNRVDMALCDMAPLFHSSLYEGTYVAYCGDTYVGISCWNGSALTGFEIERVLVPVAWLNTTLAKGFGFVVVAACVLKWAAILQASLAEVLVRVDVLGLTKLSSLTVLTGVGTYGLCRFVPTLCFLAGKIVSKDQKIKHRVFGPFGNGPITEQETLMRAVLSKIHNDARERGYAISLCNMDRDHPLRRCFASSKFKTTFMQKNIDSIDPDDLHVPIETHLQAWSSINFFDPRDI